MQLVIISGRSGSGKSTALHQLEDEGYYCIDNLPISLLPALVQETSRQDFSHFRGTAVCIDARNAWKDLAGFTDIVDALPDTVHTEILFLDAQDAALMQRFSETRRRHPLSSETTPLADAIAKERLMLGPISSDASLVLDTTQMTIYELRDAIKQRLLKNSSGTMSLLFQSFGFKRGVPADADLVFDVRMLPNPHWVKELRMKSGLETRGAGIPRVAAPGRRALPRHMRLPGHLAAALPGQQSQLHDCRPGLYRRPTSFSIFGRSPVPSLPGPVSEYPRQTQGTAISP